MGFPVYKGLTRSSLIPMNSKILATGLQIRECIIENYYFYFSNKAYVVGTHKNHINVLLRTQNTC